MAHPQHNFTSNFNGSDGHNAELTLNVNGVEKKYTPAGNDQAYNVPGVARIDINLDGADLVQAIQTALDGAAQPVLVEMSIYDEEYVYQYIGEIDDQWYFGTCTTNKIVTMTVAKEDGAVNVEQIPVTNGVVIVESDGLNVYSRLRTALALGQLPVLSYVGANPVYAQYEKTADNGDLIFVGALASASDTYVQYNIYTVASNNTVTVTTRAASAGGGGTPDDENGFFNSSLYTTPGDGVTTSLTLNDFRIKQGTSIHGSNIEFVVTHTEGGIDFGEVWLNPGTYILDIRYTLQWVGNPRGTFVPLVCRVGAQPFDFSFEQENTLNTSQIRVVTARQKVSIPFPFDADTPPMGIWVETLSIAQLASNTHSAVVHDTTLAGSGTAGSPLGVTTDVFGKVKAIPTTISQFRTGDVIPVDGPNGPAKMTKDDLLKETAQNTLAGNVAPAFDPTRTSENPYLSGEQVVFNGVIYSFINTHYGPWNINDVAISGFGEDIDNLQRSVSKSSSLSKINKKTIIDIYGNIVAAGDPNYCTAEIDLDSSFEYYLTASMNVNAGLVVIKDDNGNVISRLNGDNTLIDSKVHFTASAKKMIVGFLANREHKLNAVKKQFCNEKFFGEEVFFNCNYKTILDENGDSVAANSSEYCTSSAIQVQPGDRYLFNGRINWRNVYFVIFDESGNVICLSKSFPEITPCPKDIPYEIVIPDGGASLKIAWLDGGLSTLTKVNDSNTYIGLLHPEVNCPAPYSYHKGKVIANNGNINDASDERYSICCLFVHPGDVYRIVTHVNWGNGIFLVLDSQLNKLDYFAPTIVSGTDVEFDRCVTIPDNGFYLVVGCFQGRRIDIYNVSNKSFERSANKDKFIPIKSDIYCPVVGFRKVKDLIVAGDLPADDWRKVYPGLGYDVIYDGDNDLYRMYYAAYNGTITQIGMMTSPDMLNWTQYSNNPILTPSGVAGDPDKGGMTFPQILRFGNKYIMFYVGFDTQGFERGVHTICYAESLDLVNWTRKGRLFGTEIFPQYEKITVLYRPNVICVLGRYYMFINAGKGDADVGGNSESVYVMCSENPLDGWRYVGKCVDSEVLYAQSNYKICSDPQVVSNGNKFFMVCWSADGIICLCCESNSFPMNWKFIGKLNAGVSRPLLVPLKNKVYLISNTNMADVVTLFESMWSDSAYPYMS